MKVIFAIPLAIARAIGGVLFGTDEITEALEEQRQKALILMRSYRVY